MPGTKQLNQLSGKALPKGARGRVDLLFALFMAEREEKADTTREDALAAVLGFELLSDRKTDAETDIILSGTPATITMHALSGDVRVLSLPNPQFFPYHLVSVDNLVDEETWATKQSDSVDDGVLSDEDQVDWDASYPQPSALPIVPWTRLWPRLRRAVARTHTAALDIIRLTEQLSRGTVVRRLPRKQRLSWPTPLPVILDFSDRLMPYWHDWRWLNRQLQVRFNRQLRCYCLRSLLQQKLQPFIDGEPKNNPIDWPKLGSGDTLLVVSDLGLNDPAHAWPVRRWQEVLIAYRHQGVRVIVLAPVAVRRLQPVLVNNAEVVRLSPDSDLRSIRRMPPMDVSQAESTPVLTPVSKMLLVMMSVATRVEPGLLRALRQCLPNHDGDAGLEGEVWCYSEVDTAPTACALAQWNIQYWRDQFTQLPETLQQRTLDCLRDWHARVPQGVHHEEVLLWRHLAKRKIADKEAGHAERARQFFVKLKNTLLEQGDIDLNRGVHALQVQLAQSHVEWVSSTLGGRESYIEPLAMAVEQAEPQRASAELPLGLDPLAWLKSLPKITLTRMNLVQQSDGSLVLMEATQTCPTGATRLATLDLDRAGMLWAWQQKGGLPVYHAWRFMHDEIINAPQLPGSLTINTELQPAAKLYLYTNRQRLCLKPFQPPDWAARYGQDVFGLYADLTIKQVTQRFRWIAPGTFLMGSPESESERGGNETQHSVTLTHGFWLADTACTQALWSALMDDNPSYFGDDTNLPVEGVSWHDVQQFIERLNHRYPDDLFARLPTEAQWEYACRAGTNTPFSFGEQITSDQVNYDGDFPYADGYKGQYRQKTVAVKSLPPNPWGLYEMHGNVWEWCADWYGAYPKHTRPNPEGPKNGKYRVLRGGSWGNYGSHVRSASRRRAEPDDRSYRIGFRLALGRVGVSRQASGTEERAAAAEQGGQDGRATQPFSGDYGYRS